MHFLRQVGKQKAIEAVCDMVAPRDKLTVVGFGNWSNNGTGISRRCSGPIREIRQVLSRRPNVLYTNIDEHKTSCVCSECFERLVNMKADTVKRRRVSDGGGQSNVVVNGQRVHKVLHCCNSVGSAAQKQCCGATWNRDVNAAKNMLMLLQVWMRGAERPTAFCRTNTVSSEARSGTAPTRAPPVDPTQGSIGGHHNSLSWGPPQGEMQDEGLTCPDNPIRPTPRS